MADHTTLDDAKLKVHGVEALNKALGCTGALRFLSLVGSEAMDYVKISRRLYKNQTIDGIFNRAKGKSKKTLR